MSNYLIKPNPERDFYVDWSTIVDDAIAWGTRVDMVSMGYSEDRLERCDTRGTSAFWFSRKTDPEEDDGEIWKGSGWLSYLKMEDFFTEIEKLYPGDAEIPENLLELHPELRDFLDPLDD